MIEIQDLQINKVALLGKTAFKRLILSKAMDLQKHSLFTVLITANSKKNIACKNTEKGIVQNFSKKLK